MSQLGDPTRRGVRVDSHILRTVQHSPVQRILAFLNYSIDDVIDDPIARTAVYYRYRIHNLIGRRSAAIDAEHARLRGRSTSSAR